MSLHRLQGVRNKAGGFGRAFRRLQSCTRHSARVSRSSAGDAGDAGQPLTLGVSPPGQGTSVGGAAQQLEGRVPPWGWGFFPAQPPATRSEPGSAFQLPAKPRARTDVLRASPGPRTSAHPDVAYINGTLQVWAGGEERGAPLVPIPVPIPVLLHSSRAPRHRHQSPADPCSTGIPHHTESGCISAFPKVE